ncbi:hypothetical protein Zmor_016945 [Zophobas morio]|uniref:Uncharacterized protein n=1 Tax=Zophobas morio TaxID=2755281 RepID=A0AA38I7Y3_9CUCU|nr:hypothetical protein Zmor_016945 [Zophobas morio]
MESISVYGRMQSSENSIYVGNSAIRTVTVHLANRRLFQSAGRAAPGNVLGRPQERAGPPHPTQYLSCRELQYLDVGHLPATFADCRLFHPHRSRGCGGAGGQFFGDFLQEDFPEDGN